MNFSAQVLSLMLFLSLGFPGEVKPPEIRISGSKTMLNLTHRLTEWYEARNPGVSFSVDGSDPTQGFSSLIESKAEITQSTRKVLSGESLALRSRRKLEFVEIPVATEFAVIAVNSANPIRALTVYNLRSILSGRVKNWKQVGGNDAPITIFGRDQSSEVRNLIDEEFMGDAAFSPSITSLSTNSAVLSAVAGDSRALAFCDFDLHPQPGVRLIGIKASASGEAIEPTGDNIRAHRYTLSRTLYYYFAGPPSAKLMKFADWVLSSEGQLVVEAVGLYPLGSADRQEARLRLRKP
jgi:phosphate transport system substrate-binding protein